MSETEQEERELPEPDPVDDDDAEEAEEDEHEREPDTEPEQPPEGALSQKDIEARFKKIESAWKSYTTRIGSIMGDDALSLVECPLCADTIPGYVMPERAGHLDPAVKESVQTFLGVVQKADYKRDPDFRRCEKCDGRGKVDTDSLVPQQDLVTCSACQGRGYVGPGAQAAAVTAILSQPQPPLVDNGASVPPADVDPWGSPRLLATGLENPNFGRMPQFKDRTLP